MIRCYFCNEEYPPEQTIKKNVFDPDMQSTIEVDVCFDCGDAYDDGLIK